MVTCKSSSLIGTARQVAARLIRSHLPFGVITKKSLQELERFKILILSNVHMMDQDECDRILYADFQFEIEAPGCVEATLFRQEDRNRYLLSLLNFQQELPNIPINDIRCRLHLSDAISTVRNLNDGSEITILRTDSGLEFTGVYCTTP